MRGGRLRGFPAWSIALIQRSGGGCTFALKAASAAGVIIFKEGQPDRTGFINGTLGSTPPHGAPPVGASFAARQELAGRVLNGATGSDYAPFATGGGIPVGGLSAGDSRLKTAAQAGAYGGPSASRTTAVAGWRATRSRTAVPRRSTRCPTPQ